MNIYQGNLLKLWQYYQFLIRNVFKGIKIEINKKDYNFIIKTLDKLNSDLISIIEILDENKNDDLSHAINEIRSRIVSLNSMFFKRINNEKGN